MRDCGYDGPETKREEMNELRNGMQVVVAKRSSRKTLVLSELVLPGYFGIIVIF